MSVTLVLVPATIGPQLITALIASVTLSVAATMQNERELNEENKLGSNFNLENLTVARDMNKDFSKDYQAICSQYKTIFKDENLLIKTISEHGVQNIVKQNGKIYGNIESLQFEFEKGNDDLYEMHITHKENDDLSIVNELNEEYQMNVQEQSYMNIKKNLEKQNLTIDSEEVLEDNSIMLTVNLE